MIDIRCRNHLHLRIDATTVAPGDATVAEIKCEQCSRKNRKHAVFHTLRIAQVLDVARRGESILWIDGPETT